MYEYALALGRNSGGGGFFICLFAPKRKKREAFILIETKKLTKEFHTKEGVVTALSNVDLHIEKGDIFGIIGMSGAGKSTLLRCLCMLEKPTSGSVEIGGADVNALRGKELLLRRRKTGVIFQGYNLLMQKTVLQNVLFPLQLTGTPKEEAYERAARLLELVGLADKHKSYPTQLSGGQMQRVAIARALTTEPDVLLCDEPTSALDSLTTKSVLKLLRNINASLGVTIVIITHEIGVVKNICNKVAVIDSSTIVEWGDVETVFNEPKSDITRLLLGKEATAL